MGFVRECPAGGHQPVCFNWEGAGYTQGNPPGIKTWVIVVVHNQQTRTLTGNHFLIQDCQRLREQRNSLERIFAKRSIFEKDSV
jgi:hypothetical protein